MTRVKTRKGGNVVVAFVPYKPPASNKTAAYSTTFSRPALTPTILFSHGTAVDLGKVLSFYRCAI